MDQIRLALRNKPLRNALILAATVALLRLIALVWTDVPADAVLSVVRAALGG